MARASYILNGLIAIVAVDVAKDYSLPCDFGERFGPRECQG